LHSSCDKKKELDKDDINQNISFNRDGGKDKENDTWDHKRINSRWGQLSKRSENASINLWIYLKGIAEQIARTSDGSTANMHFLIKESSFKRRLSIRALCCWFSERASSTFYRNINYRN
jgi:hypothetical protein